MFIYLLQITIGRGMIDISPIEESFVGVMIKQKIKEILNFNVVALISFVCLGSFLVWYKHNSPSFGYLGYVEGEYVRVASPLAGALVKLPITRGMAVTPGKLLFILEHKNEIAARDEAFRRYEKAKYELANIKVGKRPEEIEVISDTLVQAEADQEFNLHYLQRQQQLIQSNATSFENLDRARSNYNHGEARIAELRAQLKVAKLPGREMEIKATEKEVAATREVLAQAQWRLDQKFILSPVKGFVFDTLYVPGEWVPAGSPITIILPPENIKVRFFVPEQQLGSLKLGQSVLIKVDGNEKDIKARITYISPTAEYTPPVIFSREWRTKQLYMVEARPLVTPELLHPGQPVDVVMGPS
jgi:HlyD family secretion protein